MRTSSKILLAAVLVAVVCLLAGCATVHGPRAIDQVPPGGQTIYDWMRVRELEASTEIAVSTGRYRASPRVLLAADDSHILVLGGRVAGLEEIVETIARDEVMEIDGAVVARGSVGASVLGGWLGFAVGVVPGLGGVAAAAGWPIVIGSAVLGAYLGHRWSSHTTDGIVYKAR